MDIDFGTSKKTGLGIVAKLATVDTPHWFADEYDGIVHMEAVMRAYMPPPSCPWKEMHSDKALSDLAFYGIGQVYVMHKSGWEKERAAQQQVAPGVMPRGVMPLAFDGDMPAGTEYILDMTFMSKYAVRDPFCRYGGAAFFNAEREVLGAKDASSFAMPFDTKSDHCTKTGSGQP